MTDILRVRAPAGLGADAFACIGEASNEALDDRLATIRDELLAAGVPVTPASIVGSLVASGAAGRSKGRRTALATPVGDVHWFVLDPQGRPVWRRSSAAAAGSTAVVGRRSTRAPAGADVPDPGGDAIEVVATGQGPTLLILMGSGPAVYLLAPWGPSFADFRRDWDAAVAGAGRASAVDAIVARLTQAGGGQRGGGQYQRPSVRTAEMSAGAIRSITAP